MRTSSRIVALALAVLASACATTQVEPPQAQHFTRMSIERPEEIPAALPLPRPRAQLLECAGSQWMAFDEINARELLAYQRAARFNTELAGLHANALGTLWDAHAGLLLEAQIAEAQHNQLGMQWAEAENSRRMLEREKAIANWSLRALVGGVLLGGIAR